MGDKQEEDEGPDTAESEKSSKVSEQVPEKASGEGDTPLGSSDEHSEAPGPTGTD